MQRSRVPSVPAARGRLPGVAMLSARYHPLFGGAAVQARRLARELHARGLRVLMLTTRAPGTARRERIDDIEVVRVRTFGARRFGSFDLVFYAGSLWPLLWRARRWSILHVHGGGAFSVLPVLLARLLRRRVVIKMTLMGSDDVLGLSGTRFGALKRRVFEWADAVVSISAPMSAAYRASEFDASKLLEMPQGVDTRRYRPATPEERRSLREELGVPVAAKLLVFVGAVFHRKGADVATRAFAALAPQRPELRLAVVGMDDTTYDPVQVPEHVEFSRGLKRELRGAGLADRVHFTGVVDDVERWMRAADLFVFPSRKEGFGTVMVEAMAVGLPCVVGALDGIAASVFRDGEDGVIVEGDDPTRWAEALGSLLDDSERSARLGRAARRTAETRYDFDVVSARYEELYQALLEGGDARARLASARAAGPAPPRPSDRSGSPGSC